MWPPSWTRNPSGGGGGCAIARSPSHPYFAYSSLKDLHSMLADAPPDSPEEPPSPVSPRPSVFHRVRIATSALRSLRAFSHPDPTATPPSEKRIVLYFTSLRVIRRTYEDCWAVRSILRGLRVTVDERDVSMDSRFLAELKGILRLREVRLPVVFLGGRFLGGAEEIRQLHESGELRRRVQGVPAASPGACERCAGIGFVLCHSCDGSRKFYSEKGGVFRSCAACNENGLVRCPECHRSEAV